MDYEAYKKAFFVDPQPEQRFAFAGTRGMSISVKDYEAALAFYTEVFGPPAYVEGHDTSGWHLGDSWFTVFPSSAGGPTNSDVSLELKTPADAERLHAAFLAAGGSGEAPSDELMYVPLRFCPVKDPFGLQWILYAPLA